MTEADQHFEKFMHDYQNMVFSTAVRLVGSEAEAKDIAQEVFLKAYQHYANLRQSPTAGGWLKTVATNLSLNHLSRYRARWSFFSELFARQDEGGEAEPDFVAPDDVMTDVAGSDRLQLIEKALRGLPAAQRVPLVLYHLQGMKYEEIAERLKISLGKVKTDILRGREALKRKLGPALLAELQTA